MTESRESIVEKKKRNTATGQITIWAAITNTKVFHSAARERIDCVDAPSKMIAM